MMLTSTQSVAAQDAYRRSLLQASYRSTSRAAGATVPAGSIVGRAGLRRRQRERAAAHARRLRSV